MAETQVPTVILAEALQLNEKDIHLSCLKRGLAYVIQAGTGNMPVHPSDRRGFGPWKIGVKGTRRASRVTAPMAPPLTVILLGSMLERR